MPTHFIFCGIFEAFFVGKVKIEHCGNDKARKSFSDLFHFTKICHPLFCFPGKLGFCFCLLVCQFHHYWKHFLSSITFCHPWLLPEYVTALLHTVWPDENCQMSIKVAQKTISQEKWMILTHLQKLPNNVGNLGKIFVATGFEWLPKVQKIAQSGHTGYIPTK